MAEIMESVKVRVATMGIVREWAEASGRTVSGLVNEILDISRLEAQQMPLDLRECDLGGLAVEALASLGSLALGNLLNHPHDIQQVAVIAANGRRPHRKPDDAAVGALQPLLDRLSLRP